MPASRIPDPARSYALLIGVSDYETSSGYAPVPTAAESARELGRLIRSPMMWDLPKNGHVKVLTGKVTRDAAHTAIEEAANRANMDGLFVYICAHGQVFTDDWVPDRNLHFAFTDSEVAWSHKQLPFLAVRRMLTRRPNAAATLLVIDSCYAGGAFLGAAGTPLAYEAERLVEPEYCTLVAAKGKQLVPSECPGSPYTPFAGAIIDVIENGIDAPAEFLTPKAVENEVRRKLLEAQFPEPDMRSNGTSVFVCRNKRYQPVALFQPLDQLLRRLDQAESVRTAVYATAIEERWRSEGQAAKQIVKVFGEKRTSTESFELATALRTSGTAELSEYADLLIERVYECRRAQEILGLLHRHEGPSPDVESLLRKLLEQPDADHVLADVSHGLRDMGCVKCTAIRRQVDSRMFEVWPKDRWVGLLSVLY